MIFCEGCFNDIELKSVIRSINKKGDCHICGKSDIFIYDTDTDIQLTDYFDEFINIYTPSSLLPPNYPKTDLSFLKDELLEKWDIFSNNAKSKAYDILVSICKDKYDSTPELFDGEVGISELTDSTYLEQNSILRTNSWEDFVNSLKMENRFHTSHINKDILQQFCTYIKKTYKEGQLFYRGRIATEKGYEKTEMGVPSPEKASAGRANAAGIRCLYLSNDIKTTIHEIRAGTFDYVSIGAFELQKDISVADFKAIHKISPFIGDIGFTRSAINREHLKKINDEMAKPLRRNDSLLDYIPTEYISDFIKSITRNEKKEYDGLEYNSTMTFGGYNLAIFYPHLFVCKEVKTYRIDSIEYNFEIQVV
jgi:hypothetical protein